MTSGTPHDGLLHRVFGEDGFTFGDLIDLVNPLQHIPVLGSYYRKWTGDTIAPALRIAGGALFGGPIGAGLAAAGLAFEAGVRGALDLPGTDATSTTAIAARATADDAPAGPGAAGEPTASPAMPTAHAGPGGWLVAQARQVTPEPPAPAGDVAVTPAAPGGWLVAAGRTVMPEALADVEAPAVAGVRPAPGGWLVAAGRPWPPPGSATTDRDDGRGLAWLARDSAAGRLVDLHA